MYQWAFLIFLYLLGLLYIDILFPDLQNRDRQFLSPFFGVGFSALAVGLLLIVRIILSLWVFIMCLLIILCLARVFTQKFSLYTFSLRQSLNKFLFDVFSAPFLVYAVLSYLFSMIVLSDASPDSTQFEGAGRYLVQGGLVNFNTPQMAFMLNGRLLIVGAMHALNRLFHGYHLYAVNPTMSVWLLLFLAYTIFVSKKTIDKVTRIFLAFFFMITLGFYKHFFNGMFDIHSNQLAMIYYSLAIVSLYFFVERREQNWVYVGSLAIGFACLTRVDMLFCSLIFFFILVFILASDHKTTKYCWYIFLVVLLPWRIFTLYYTPWNIWYVSAKQLSLLIGANIGLCIASFVLHKSTGE